MLRLSLYRYGKNSVQPKYVANSPAIILISLIIFPAFSFPNMGIGVCNAPRIVFPQNSPLHKSVPTL